MLYLFKTSVVLIKFEILSLLFMHVSYNYAGSQNVCKGEIMLEFELLRAVAIVVCMICTLIVGKMFEMLMVVAIVL